MHIIRRQDAPRAALFFFVSFPTMLTIELVLASGEHVRMPVVQAQFVVTCPYCKIMQYPPEFLTVNPDQRFCRQSHRVGWYKKLKAPTYYRRKLPSVV